MEILRLGRRMGALLFPLLKFAKKVKLPFYRLNVMFSKVKDAGKGCSDYRGTRQHEWPSERQEKLWKVPECQVGIFQ